MVNRQGPVKLEVWSVKIRNEGANCLCIFFQSHTTSFIPVHRFSMYMYHAYQNTWKLTECPLYESTERMWHMYFVSFTVILVPGTCSTSTRKLVAVHHTLAKGGGGGGGGK